MRPRRGPPHGGSPRGGPPSGSLLGARLRRPGRHPRSTHREFNKLTTVVLRAGAGQERTVPTGPAAATLSLGKAAYPFLLRGYH
jgi:hypothetical protein